MASPAHTALYEIGDTEAPPNLAEINGPVAKREGRVAGYDEQRAKACQACDELIRDAITEVGIIGLTAQVLERQNRDGWSV